MLHIQSLCTKYRARITLYFTQDANHTSLKNCYEHLKPSSRKMVELDTSTVGFALEACSYTQYAVRDGVHALFSGEVATWPDFSAVEASHNGMMKTFATKTLAQRFPCIILPFLTQRLFAARTKN